MPPPPKIKTILVCEKVIHDSQTANHSLINVLLAVGAEEFPLVIPLHLYLCVTEVRQAVTLEVRFVRKSTEELRYSGQMQIECDEPLAYVGTATPAMLVEFPEAGCYEFQVWYEGQFLDSMEVMAHQFEPEEQEEEREGGERES